MVDGAIPVPESARAQAGPLPTQPEAGRAADYLRIVRVDHWFKNVLVLPGTAAAAYFHGAAFGDFAPALAVGLLAACLVASANYVLNEWLDAAFDRFHPLKKYRPSVARRLVPRIVWAEYALLSAAGIGLAWLVSPLFCAGAAALWIQGVAYNVRPLRTKDRAYLDVLSEAVNNPIRLLLGWWAVAPGVPPWSLVLGYWMLGAFLMGVKRYAEMRFIGSPELASRYRRSFGFYTEERLLISEMFYAFAASFCFAFFILLYRLELLLTLPLLAVAFAWYLQIGAKPASAAQTPERLYAERGFVAYLALVAAAIALAFALDAPWLAGLLGS